MFEDDFEYYPPEVEGGFPSLVSQGCTLYIEDRGAAFYIQMWRDRDPFIDDEFPKSDLGAFSSYIAHWFNKAKLDLEDKSLAGWDYFAERDFAYLAVGDEYGLEEDQSEGRDNLQYPAIGGGDICLQIDDLGDEYFMEIEKSGMTAAFVARRAFKKAELGKLGKTMETWFADAKASWEEAQ